MRLLNIIISRTHWSCAHFGQNDLNLPSKNTQPLVARRAKLSIVFIDFHVCHHQFNEHDALLSGSVSLPWQYLEHSSEVLQTPDIVQHMWDLFVHCYDISNKNIQNTNRIYFSSFLNSISSCQHWETLVSFIDIYTVKIPELHVCKQWLHHISSQYPNHTSSAWTLSCSSLSCPLSVWHVFVFIYLSTLSFDRVVFWKSKPKQPCYPKMQPKHYKWAITCWMAIAIPIWDFCIYIVCSCVFR